MLEGGHDIPPSLIEHRFQIGLSYLKSKILEFTEATLIDVSQKAPKQMAILKLSRIEYKHHEILPWVKETLHLAERLQQKLDISEEEKPKPNIGNKLE